MQVTATTGDSLWRQRLCSALAGYALVGGAVSFLGWTLDIPRLTDWDNNGIAIQPNAAVLAALSGAALLLLQWCKHRIVLALGALVGLIGALMLLQHVLGVDFGFNHQLTFGHQWGRAGTVTPGRVGPPASTCFMLLGAALVLLGCSHGQPGRAQVRRFVPPLGLAVSVIALFSLIGYLAGVEKFYAIPWLTAIAFQTTTMLMALAVGLIVSVPERQPMRLLVSPSGAGALARRILPLTVLLPLLLSAVATWGEGARFYDAGTGRSLLLLGIVLLGALSMWWTFRTLERHELSARDSAMLLGETLESINDGFARLDGQWRLVYLNRQAETLGGSKRESMLGRPWHEAFPPLAGLHAREAFERARREQAPVELESYDESADRWYLIKANAMRDAGLAVLIQDITVRRRTEEALRNAARRKDEFLATLAHELRNPLAPVRNAVKILHLKGPAVPELQWARDVIDRQVRHMTRLIDDLLDVSRLSRGKIKLQREHVHLAKVVHRAIEACRPLIEQHEHELSVLLPSDPVQVDGDFTRLVQVLSNLLDNAAKYSERGGRIVVTAERQGDDAVVTVRDFGIGIAPDMLSKVFEMFEQADGFSDKSQGGLGIGLTLVKRLVEMHGGRVEARSEGRGKGSEFVVCLPALTEPAATARQTRRAQSGTMPVSSHRVLIVDDNRDAADSLAMMMKMMGSDVRTAYDGADAVRLARAFRPDVVLLDIGLPTMDGHETARAIRSEPWGKEILLIAVTGWGQDDDRRQSSEAGFDHHLVKPVDPSALLALLASRAARAG